MISHWVKYQNVLQPYFFNHHLWTWTVRWKNCLSLILDMKTKTTVRNNPSVWSDEWTWMWLTTVGHVRSKVNDDGEPAAVASVVGERRAEAGRPALTRVRATLLMEGCWTKVLVTGGEQILIQHIAHLWSIDHWGCKGAGRDVMTKIQTLNIHFFKKVCCKYVCERNKMWK